MYTIYYHKKPTVKATGNVHTPQVQAHRTTLDFNYVPRWAMLAVPIHPGLQDDEWFFTALPFPSLTSRSMCKRIGIGKNIVATIDD